MVCFVLSDCRTPLGLVSFWRFRPIRFRRIRGVLLLSIRLDPLSSIRDRIVLIYSIRCTASAGHGAACRFIVNLRLRGRTRWINGLIGIFDMRKEEVASRYLDRPSVRSLFPRLIRDYWSD